MIRRHACLRIIAGAILALAAPAHAREQPGIVAIAPDADARWVPFMLTPGNQIRFTLTLDGAPVTAILDTGVSLSVLAQRYVDEHKLAFRKGGTAAVIGGTVSIGRVETREVSVGGLTRRGGPLAVAALPATATGGATPVDMLVGRDLIGAAALDLDYEHRRFRLLPSGRMPFAGAIAPLAISRDRLVYVTTMKLGAATLRPVIVDTGDGAPVTVSATSWRAAALRGLRTTTAITYGLAGPVTSAVVIAPTLGIGGLNARQVELRVEDAGGFSESVRVAGRIGTGFLQNYRVLMDPRAGRMVLSPGPGADQPPLKSTSGLLTGLLGDRLRVLHVMKNSPAEASGWKVGDMICSVDGKPIPADYVSSGGTGWTIGAPGRVVTLGLCDGTTRTLTLSTFY